MAPITTPLRLAAPADAPRIAALGIFVWLHTYASDGISDAIARHVLDSLNETHIARLIADPARRLIVAERDNTLLAYAVLRFGGGHRGIRCEIETLYVHPGFARHGIGGALLHRARQEALARCGDAAVWLTVNARNPRALSFYQAQGFVDEGERGFELDGTQHLNRLLVLA
ncbi:GNAT family N-acetyltransferase [Niveibacterium sp. 24ML]|uniref:GNAT family N-acetyltransferase n=1 Tax=Niveibacterium sp. 24ML TaxID=2985512 RepID=UPI002271A257|nr:GNAT family N-acetyltransferase [Niveibacterium sp. 24ML]MCX9157364.1 GNAT family N-acetyltransferase [Niveibacterium sp. 24ML]